MVLFIAECQPYLLEVAVLQQQRWSDDFDPMNFYMEQSHPLATNRTPAPADAADDVCLS